ncbi:MAG: metallophosphoesterase family protein [bacterium]|nr:metallophosphoesterase family protein [bacterium]
MRTLLLSVLGLGALVAGNHPWRRPDREPGPGPISNGEAVQQGDGAVRDLEAAPRPVVAPYLIDISPSSATVCWVTREELAGELVLASVAGEATHTEPEARRFHRIELTGLEPGQDYGYSIGGVYAGRFRTTREDRPLRVAIFGHTGGTEVANKYPTTLLASRIDELDPDFAICTGDLCYFTSHQSFADLFFERFARFLARKPIYVAPGNHEAGFPLAYGYSYGQFRDLFPREYPDVDPYFSTVHGNAKFVFLAYTAHSRPGFARQLEWLKNELDQSTSEFNIVCLGGAQDPIFFDRKAFMSTLVESRVDIVFAGDGSGNYQADNQGIQWFFSGTNGTRPHTFYDLEVLPYELRVRLYDASGIKQIKHWSFPTTRPKRVVANLTETGRPDAKKASTLFYPDAAASSNTFDGVRVVVHNSHDRRVPILLRWAPSDATRRGADRFFREQPVWMAPGEITTFLYPLPATNPITGKAWLLDDLQLAANEKYLPKGYAFKPDVLEFSLIANE